MKAVRFLGVLVLSALLLQSCDFFRSVLGKPTSADLQVIQAAMDEQKTVAESSVADSIEQVKDVAEEKSSVAVKELTGAVSAPQSGYRYYVVAGSFKVPSNAEGFVNLSKKNGLSAEKIDMGNGFTAVSIYGTDSVMDAILFANDAQKYDFVPMDPWILDVINASK